MISLNNHLRKLDLECLESFMREIGQGRQIAGLVFDVDGFVLDTMPTLVESFRVACLDVVGVEITEAYLHQFSGLNDVAFCAHLRQQFGADFPYEEVRRVQESIAWQIWERDGVELKPGVDQVLGLLSELQVPLAAGSGSRKGSTDRKLQLARIAERFDAVVGGDEVCNGKPAPETFLLAKQRLEQLGVVTPGISPRRFLAGGDAAADVHAASAAGMYSIYVPEPGQFSRVVAQSANFVFRSLSEATGTIRALLTSE